MNQEFNMDEFKQQLAESRVRVVKTVRRTVCRTVLAFLLVNLAALAVSVGIVACVILGCLKLFGVI